MKRIIFDTNVTIAAFFWDGNPRKIYNAIKEGKYELITSEEIIEELVRVLHYKKFGLNAQEILPLINDYKKHSTIIKTTLSLEIIKEDLTDNIFLECANDSNAHYIISGDSHLLNLKTYKKVEIILSAEFVKVENKF